MQSRQALCPASTCLCPARALAWANHRFTPVDGEFGTGAQTYSSTGTLRYSWYAAVVHRIPFRWKKPGPGQGAGPTPGSGACCSAPSLTEVSGAHY
jgi:hypothetical protein